MELDCGGGEGGVKWCISNVWKNIVEATERTRVSVNSAASVLRNVMNYYLELCTLNKQLKQTFSVPVKELTFFLWTLTRREESERKKERLVHFRH